MADIFISYASADREKVRPFAEALEKTGWQVWWDRQIRSGSAFDRKIEQALDEAQCVIVIWSHNSAESDWVRAEAGDGLERGILVSIAIEHELPLERAAFTLQLKGARLLVHVEFGPGMDIPLQR